MLDRQDVFNRVMTHLRAQGKRSMSYHSGCAYRGVGDTCCAIGHLIADEHYRLGFEGEPASSLKVCAAVEKSLGVSLDVGDTRFLEDLQLVHDMATDDDFDTQALAVIVPIYGLEMPR